MKHALYSGSTNLYGDMQTAAKSLIAKCVVQKMDGSEVRHVADLTDFYDEIGF